MSPFWPMQSVQAKPRRGFDSPARLDEQIWFWSVNLGESFYCLP